MVRLPLEEKLSEHFGKPYKNLGRGDSGIDCVGLLFALCDVLQIPVEDSWRETKYSDNPSAEDGEKLRLFLKSKARHWWRRKDLPDGELRIGDVLAFDNKALTHTAIYIGDGWMIHALKSVGVVCHRLSSPYGRAYTHVYRMA